MTTITEIRQKTDAAEPWQLRMFRRTLKKQQKLKALLRQASVLGGVAGQECLLLTCGDNNGALNWHFKQHGGNWTWADMEQNSVDQIASLTGDDVVLVDKEAGTIPFADHRFDVIITIDVHEHLRDPGPINEELTRVLKPGGRIIVTTPGGDPHKLANRIKHLLGMHAQDYGHVVDGYSADALEEQLRQAALQPIARSSYSRFFTEMVELVINFAYVKLLSKGSDAGVEAGQIAPQNEDQLQSVGKSYKLYSAAYPLFWAISQLDRLLAFSEGYAVIVSARKDA